MAVAVQSRQELLAEHVGRLREYVDDRLRASALFVIDQLTILDKQNKDMLALVEACHELEDREYEAEEAISCLEWFLRAIGKKVTPALEDAVERARTLIANRDEICDKAVLGKRHRELLQFLRDILPLLGTDKDLHKKARALLVDHKP